MISGIINTIKIIFLLGFLVLIHEGGHFLVAKLCKVKVNEFSIGFGKAIWKKQGNVTLYSLRIIPLGGFVQMEGVSYGSRGSAALVDLAGLNFAIRMTLSGKNIQYNILAPTSIKKFAVGNGSAEKDVMIASWKKLDKNISNISDIKVDDLADSYFIAQYQ